MIVERIAKETGLNPEELAAIIRTASQRYKTYPIPKRTGGIRIISQPTPAVKFLQRWVVRNVISYLPVHAAVKSYRVGVGVRANAEVHVDSSFLMKADFENFFPSIRRVDIVELLARGRKDIPALSNLSVFDIAHICDIVCKGDVLSIGAPSSPALSNAVLYDFDAFVSEQSSCRGVLYSRYADDISFSTKRPNVLSDILAIVQARITSQSSPRLRINKKKTSFSSRKQRQMVTGLMLTSDGKISIGRDKKRKIKSLCFLFSVGKLPPLETSYLRGYLSYVQSVDPDFLQALNRKFGGELLQGIMNSPLVTRKY